MKRGEIWTANLNPETGKIRPALLIQADVLTDAGLPTVVLPLTTQLRPGLSKLRVNLPARDRLRQTYQVMVDQPRAIGRNRLGEGPLTSLSRDEMDAVERGLAGVSGLFR